MLDTQATVEKIYHLRPTEVAFLTAFDHFNHLGWGGETRIGQKKGSLFRPRWSLLVADILRNQRRITESRETAWRKYLLGAIASTSRGKLAHLCFSLFV